MGPVTISPLNTSLPEASLMSTLCMVAWTLFWKAIVNGLPAGPATSGVVNWVASAPIETSPFGAWAFDGAEPPDPLPGPAAAPGAGEPGAAVVEVKERRIAAWRT